MNRQKSIALFAIIAAVAVTSIGLTGVSATPLMLASIPQTQEGMVMLGHVEYTLLDSDGLVKAYIQGDNAVVDDGKDCVAREVFGALQGSGNCAVLGNFQYIAIGNGTGTVDGTESNLDSLGVGLCADSGAGETGEMARKLVTPSITTAAANPAGTVIELDTTGDEFTFSANNATTVEQSGIFNGDVLGTNAGEGSCASPGAAGTDWQMFSMQELNGGTGIQVTDGDSLSVKWTITIGA